MSEVLKPAAAAAGGGGGGGRKCFWATDIFLLQIIYILNEVSPM
jgi:hypothetical protein